MLNKLFTIVFTILLISCGNRTTNHSTSNNKEVNVEPVVNIQYENKNIYITNNTESALKVSISYLST